MFAAAIGSARADLLWDQYTNQGLANNVVDQEFGDFPTFSTYIVGDVSVGGTGWNVNSVSGTFNNNGNTLAGWANVTTARLNVFAKSGVLPGAGDNPAAGTVVGISINALNSTDWEVIANGLNFNLAAGGYWIGLTPIADFGVNGQIFHYHAATVGDPSAARNPGGGFGVGTAWGNMSMFGQTVEDTTLRVQGTNLAVPEPATMAVLGMGALALIRRRRKA